MFWCHSGDALSVGTIITSIAIILKTAEICKQFGSESLSNCTESKQVKAKSG